MIEETLQIEVSIRGETREDIEKTKASITLYFAELQKATKSPPKPKRNILKEMEDVEDAMEDLGYEV